MNKNILGIFKKMTKDTNSEKTNSRTWIESKKQMVSILSMQLQKQKVDDHFRNVHVNDFHTGIHSWVSLS
jgi:hypothetical protein